MSRATLMPRLLFALLLSATVAAIGPGRWGAGAQTASSSAPPGAQCPSVPDKAKTYDVIVFGDEVPGVMTALQLKQELWKRKQFGKVALITEGDVQAGIGGAPRAGRFGLLGSQSGATGAAIALWPVWQAQPLISGVFAVDGDPCNRDGSV